LAIKDFKKDFGPSTKVYLLVDLDGPSETKQSLLALKGLNQNSDYVFFQFRK